MMSPDVMYVKWIYLLEFLITGTTGNDDVCRSNG
jgi:hypothetical protein